MEKNVHGSDREEKIKDRKNARLESAIENFQNKEIPERTEKKKNKWLGSLVLLLSIGIGVFLIIQMSSSLGEEQLSFSEVFASVKWQNAAIAVVALVAIILLDIFKYVVVLHATTHKLHPLIGAKTALLGKYYDNITPFSTGGQPMQIYYLYKKGFGGGLSSAVVMIKYFFNTTAWLLVAFVAMVFNTAVLQRVETGNVLLIAGWIGWALNVCLPVFLILFVIMPKMAKKLTAWLIRVAYKLKIVKDKERAMKKALSVVRDFRSSFVIMGKRPVHLVLLSLSCIAELALTFAFPYYIIRMFNGFQVDAGLSTMFEVMALNAYAAFAASVVPTPGNSGAMEGLITMAFSAMAGATLMWVIFTWRFAVYYIYIIIGVGLTVFNFLRNVVRSRRAAKQQQLSSGNALPAKTDTSQRSVQVIVDEDTVSSTQTAENQLSSEEKATSAQVSEHTPNKK